VLDPERNVVATLAAGASSGPALQGLGPGRIDVLSGESLDRLEIETLVPLATRGDGLRYTLRFGIAPGTIDARWSR
jgi:hypothetical protein